MLHFTSGSVQMFPKAGTSETAVLDGIVVRDPERYLAWLSSMGYFYFTTNSITITVILGKTGASGKHPALLPFAASKFLL